MEHLQRLFWGARLAHSSPQAVQMLQEPPAGAVGPVLSCGRVWEGFRVPGAGSALPMHSVLTASPAPGGSQHIPHSQTGL